MFIIEVYEIDSDEEIKNKYIEKFLITNLKLKGVEFTKKSKFLYSYIEPLKIYQILFFEEKIPNFLYLKTEKENEIILSESYVAVFKNKNFYYYQEIEKNISNEEIIPFLEKRLMLKNIYIQEEKEYIEDKNLKYKILKPIKSNTFKYFIIYFFSLLICFYYFEFNINNNFSNLKKISINTKSLKDKLEFTSVSKIINNLTVLSKQNSIKITSIVLKDSQIAFQLESKTKNKIYEFFKNLKKDSHENIIYNEEKNRFISDVIFKIDRR